MNYIENIYICLAAPVLAACIFLNGRSRRIMIFLLAGITSCLLSSYITSFIAAVGGADKIVTSIEVAPLIEEIMKFMPLLFYMVVFSPAEKDETANMVMVTAVGFATLENVSYLTIHGAGSITNLIIRGFGTGTMHVVSSLIMSVGLIYLWKKLWLRLLGTIGLLSLASTFHAIYNILVLQEEAVARVGYIIPVGTAFCILMGRRAFSERE
ncbi:MAG: PrsW family intramembrane metalloprotease [Lachnospiraceae bacterium]|jgi:RsiW-degrading membrane proteinase PrsW (M82 family)|nr:PrsW family intramembrane metalloprotease [Lachnospiraceae bacterium]